MFYAGDLQSGIGKAIQESKLVACFVTDDGEESQLWEDDFLAEPSLKSSLSRETILLRLKAGSQEAEYLAAIFPLPQVPTLVIIQSGELKEYIAAGVSKDEFIRRITALLESRAASIPAPAPAPAPAPVDPVQPHVQDAGSVPESDSGVLESETPQAHNAPATAVSAPANAPASRDAPPTAQEEPKEQKKLDKGKQKEESGHQKPTTSEMNYALMLKKQQQEKRDERARILKKVEDDRILRRKDAAERKAAAEKSRSNSEEPAAAGSNKPKRKQPKQYAECALQIRLFDGSTIRSRFPSSATLRVDVRPWIDEHQDGNTAYTFKQILTPLPNKNISISDEEQSLQSQGLAPNATLIIVPVPGSITAYDNSANAGVVSKGISAGYGWASWGTGVVTGLFGTLIPGRPAPQQREEQSSPTPEASTPSSSGINVRTLRDQNRPDEQQFYNGNALNFEPRNKEDEKKEE